MRSKRATMQPSHVARVFAAGLRKWGKPAVEVEQAVLDEGERVGNVLRRYLRVINGISTVSPLLGLAGTVWGMMNAFNVIATNSAMGRAEMLAGGISVALVTTASGLMVAIPAMILYLFFVGRVDSLVMEIDGHGQELVHLISAEGLKSASWAARPCSAANRPRAEASPNMPLKVQHDEQPQLNLTPMIDVVFLLIIFFMVATTFGDLERNMELQVPEVADAGDSLRPNRPLVINVFADGTLDLDGQPVTLEELTTRLAEATTRGGQPTVVIRGDAECPFQRVADALAACQRRISRSWGSRSAWPERAARCRAEFVRRQT